MTDKSIKLAALDNDDLAVISAHLQDAIMRVGDIRWMKRQSKLALAARRYDHLKAGGDAARGERKLSAMQVSRVNRVSASNIRMNDKDAVLSLLAITFEPGDTAPEGTIVLTFSGGGTIRADVECIEVAMADLGPSWQARGRPEHDTGDDETGDSQS
ncbi:MAG: DUF2948 family protein [Anderseniella sp.]|nr:DUF2948 family protein [Anderseniella sp.]